MDEGGLIRNWQRAGLPARLPREVPFCLPVATVG